MHPAHQIAALAAALWLAAAPAAQAQVAQAAQTGVGTLFPCPSFCGGTGGRFDFDIDGGAGQSSSYSSLSNADGHGQAQVTLTGPTQLPILKADAFSPAGGNSRVQAEATGLQGFYLGTGSLGSYTLNVTLTGSTDYRLAASVMLFKDSDPTSAPDFTTSAGTLAFEIIPNSGDLSLLDIGDVDLPSDGLPHSASFSLTASGLATGDLIYVWAQLSASGQSGGYADGFNTLNLAFANSAGLSQTAPVPEPATWGLMALGLAGLARRVRRA